MGEIERGRRVIVPPYLKPQKEERKEAKGEKRLRIKGVEEVAKGSVKLNKAVYEEMGSPGELEVVESEKKRTFLAMPDEKTPQQEIWANPEDLRALGIAEGTVVTVRRTK